jgi:hypothetical protein
VLKQIVLRYRLVASLASGYSGQTRLRLRMSEITLDFIGVPDGIRTRVTDVKGRVTTLKKPAKSFDLLMFFFVGVRWQPFKIAVQPGPRPGPRTSVSTASLK